MAQSRPTRTSGPITAVAPIREPLPMNAACPDDRARFHGDAIFETRFGMDVRRRRNAELPVGGLRPERRREERGGELDESLLRPRYRQGHRASRHQGHVAGSAEAHARGRRGQSASRSAGSRRRRHRRARRSPARRPRRSAARARRRPAAWRRSTWRSWQSRGAQDAGKRPGRPWNLSEKRRGRPRLIRPGRPRASNQNWEPIPSRNV